MRRMIMILVLSSLVAACGSVSRVTVLRHPDTGQVAECRVDPWGDVNRTRQIEECTAAYQRAGFRVAGDSERRESRQESEPVQTLRTALARLEASDWESAAALSTKAIAAGALTVNQAAAAHAIRSYAQYRMGRITEARADIERTIQLKPDFAQAKEFRETLIRYRRPQTPAAPHPAPDRAPRPPIIEF